MLGSKTLKKRSNIFARLCAFMMVLVACLSMFCLPVGATTTISATGKSQLLSILTNTPVNGFVYSVGDKTYDAKLSDLYYYDGTGNPVYFSLFGKRTDRSKVTLSNAITFNYVAFNQMDSKLQEASLSAFVKAMNNSSIGKSDKSKIYAEIRNNCSGANSAMIAVIFEDSRADMNTAMDIFHPFSGVVGTIIGIGCIIIIVLLVSSTVLDLCYINFPFFQNFADSHGGGGGGSSTGGKPVWVTRDAYAVVNDGATGGRGNGNGGKYQNVNFAYLKKRIVTYIVLAICLLYLLSGQITGLIAWLLNLVSGFEIG